MPCGTVGGVDGTDCGGSKNLLVVAEDDIDDAELGIDDGFGAGFSGECSRGTDETLSGDEGLAARFELELIVEGIAGDGDEDRDRKRAGGRG